jgi:hypothetical protein
MVNPTISSNDESNSKDNSHSNSNFRESSLDADCSRLRWITRNFLNGFWVITSGGLEDGEDGNWSDCAEEEEEEEIMEGEMVAQRGEAWTGENFSGGITVFFGEVSFFADTNDVLRSMKGKLDDLRFVIDDTLNVSISSFFLLLSYHKHIIITIIVYQLCDCVLVHQNIIMENESHH